MPSFQTVQLTTKKQSVAQKVRGYGDFARGRSGLEKFRKIQHIWKFLMPSNCTYV